MVVFAKGAFHSLSKLSYAGYDVVGLDWTIDPHIARDFVHIAVQGIATYWTFGGLTV